MFSIYLLAGPSLSTIETKKGICKVGKLYLMKGTIYLWVLAAVLSGALVGLLGFAIEVFFSLQSSFMKPIIVSDCRGRGGIDYDCAVPKRESRIAGQNSRLDLRPAFEPNPVASHSDPLIGEGTKVFARLWCEGLRIFSWLVLQAARALVLFVFEPGDVFRGIGEALQAGFEDGGIGDLM